MRPPDRYWNLLFAILFVSLATLFSAIFEGQLPRTMVLPFALAVMFSAWKAGLAGGLVATLLSLASFQQFFSVSEPSGVVSDDRMILAVFTVVSLIMGILITRLRTRTDRLSHVLDLATDGFWDWNVETGKVYFSPRWISSLGYEPTEVPPLLQSWERLLHPDDRDRTMAALHDHFEGRVPIYEVENRMLEKSGKWRWNLDRGKVVERDRRGRPLRMVGVDVDITAAKIAAEEAAARRALEAMNEEKDRVLGLVSHELRNPLNAISMALWSVRPGKRTPEKVNDALRLIESAVRQQAMLVDDLLDRARLNGGKFELKSGPVDLTRVVENAIAAVSRDSEGKGVAIERKIEPGTESLVGDERRLTQVLWNLLSNAIKFTPSGGKVAVRSYLDGDLSISVTDTGRGIQSDAIPHLFEPYWQLRPEDADKLGGLGLGLSLVKEIVERSGGRVDVHSAGEGKGSTFTVRLPVTPAMTRAGND